MGKAAAHRLISACKPLHLKGFAGCTFSPATQATPAIQHSRLWTMGTSVANGAISTCTPSYGEAKA
eukprot:1143106-Pelagomonas_calceolata.AAC.2